MTSLRYLTLNNSFPKRKKNRLAGYDYSSGGAYFVTVCVQNPNISLWNRVGADIIRPNYEFVEEAEIPLSEQGEIVETAINNIPQYYKNIEVDKYCIMPDHIHLIVFITSERDGRIISAPTLSTVVGQMKRWASKQIGQSIWQKGFYDRILDNDNAYLEVWQYIDNNPRKYSKDFKY